MKESKVKFEKKKLTKKSSTTQSLTKPISNFWKRYVEKKKEDIRPHEQITDDNWWEFI